MKVLLSIKPEFVEQILNGNKKFEYRKRIFKKEVESVVIYSTMPVGKIIGEFTIEKIINDSPKEIWDLTNEFSGITEDFFWDYFCNHDEGYAIKIKNFIMYEEPISPNKIFRRFVAPQSFRYLEEFDFNKKILSAI